MYTQTRAPGKVRVLDFLSVLVHLCPPPLLSTMQGEVLWKTLDHHTWGMTGTAWDMGLSCAQGRCTGRGAQTQLSEGSEDREGLLQTSRPSPGLLLAGERHCVCGIHAGYKATPAAVGASGYCRQLPGYSELGPSSLLGPVLGSSSCFQVCLDPRGFPDNRVPHEVWVEHGSWSRVGRFRLPEGRGHADDTCLGPKRGGGARGLTGARERALCWEPTSGFRLQPGPAQKPLLSRLEVPQSTLLLPYVSPGSSAHPSLLSFLPLLPPSHLRTAWGPHRRLTAPSSSRC